MNNPVVHVLVFVAAVLIPGGLLVYFTWRLKKAKKAREAEKEKAQNLEKSLPEKLQNF